MKDNFLQIAEEHAGRYPLMEPQDFGKLAYQSEFGAEHFISDKQQAESFLFNEWKALPKWSVPQFSEPVSESLCRFPLSICSSTDEIGLLLKLFIHTAEEHRGNVNGLEEKLELLQNMEVSGIRSWLAEWKKKGYPPVHHSSTFREKYHPHYRLIQKGYADYFSVILEIYRITQRGMPAVIAIDGRCGSGKTYLAGLIERLFPCNICHMDDFYMPFEQRQKNWMDIPGGNMDLVRFLTEVLIPIKAGKQIAYRSYDCEKNRIGKTVQMPFHKLTVVEGSYSHHPMLTEKYDLTIFLTCSMEKQRKRLQIREGDYFSVFEKLWIPMEENYLQHYSIETGSNLVVDTSDY